MPGEPNEPRLKQVSVLFTDVVGSTALGGRLDPEDIHDVMDAALRRFTTIIASHGGRVLKYTGDGLLAAFGTEAAQEDDAELAVRAGLGLLDEARRIGVEVRRDYASRGVAGFDIRVGVDTGPVLLGGGVEADANIRGAVVSMAARMEQSAPAAGLRISHATFQQVRGLFDVVEQGPIHVKGCDEALVTFLVERARPHSFRKANRGIPGLATKVIGRDRELGQLQSALAKAAGERRCTGITVVAEAGVGKSTLLYEFERWALAASPGLSTFRSRAQPQSRHRPYGLLREVIASGLDLRAGGEPEAAAATFEQRLVALLEAEDGFDAARAHAHLLGQLIGFDFSASPHLRGIIDDPRQIRSRAFNALTRVVRNVQARSGSPVLLLLDDLHWADEGSLDAIDHLVRVITTCRSRGGIARPEFIGIGRHGLAHGVAHAGRPHRWARSPRRARRRAAASVRPGPVDLGTFLVDHGEAIPSTWREMLKMLIDASVIAIDGEHWRLRAGSLDALAVPPTLTGVIQARLDRLPSAARSALQKASMIGPVFWDEALAAIDAGALAALDLLEQRAFVVAVEPSTFGGKREFAFAHHILHQVTYDGTLRRRAATAMRASPHGFRASRSTVRATSPARLPSISSALATRRMRWFTTSVPPSGRPSATPIRRSRRTLRTGSHSPRSTTTRHAGASCCCGSARSASRARWRPRNATSMRCRRSRMRPMTISGERPFCSGAPWRSGTRATSAPPSRRCARRWRSRGRWDSRAWSSHA
jgi:class 3 adenylate cyclase